MELEITRPCWLIAYGNAERVEVLRSPLVQDTHKWLQPVSQYIREHDLVLAARETFEDPDWMFGEVEVSVYVSPAMRNGVLAGTELSLPWFAATAVTGAE